MRTNVKYIIIIICLLVGITYQFFDLISLKKCLKTEIALKNGYDKDLRIFKSQHFDKQISDLKYKNKVLYDSIKIYKDQVTFLTQFKYEKKYVLDTVYVDKKSNKAENVYEYASGKTDSLWYNLKIGSTVEPSWYKIDIGISDKFTVVNTKSNIINETTISATNRGEISDVTVFSKKQNKFWDKFYIGPVVSAGYDITNNNFGVVIGVGVGLKF